MWRTIFIIFIALHGLIHLMGFVKAFHLAEISQLTQPISKLNGILWMLGMLLMITTAVAFGLEKNWWWQIALVAVVCSQVAIFTSWHDARFGTIANAIILVITIANFVGWSFFRSYEKELRKDSAPPISATTPKQTNTFTKA